MHSFFVFSEVGHSINCHELRIWVYKNTSFTFNSSFLSFKEKVIRFTVFSTIFTFFKFNLSEWWKMIWMLISFLYIVSFLKRTCSRSETVFRFCLKRTLKVLIFTWKDEIFCNLYQILLPSKRYVYKVEPSVNSILTKDSKTQCIQPYLMSFLRIIRFYRRFPKNSAETFLFSKVVQVLLHQKTVAFQIDIQWNRVLRNLIYVCCWNIYRLLCASPCCKFLWRLQDCFFLSCQNIMSYEKDTKTEHWNVRFVELFQNLLWPNKLLPCFSV